MADPFGIIGLISVATQVIQVGVRVGLDWKDAPADVKAFKNELQALKTVLSELNTNVIMNKDLQDAFLGKHSVIFSQLEPGQHTDTSQMLTTCRVVLEALILDLKKRSQGHRIGWERLKAAFLAKQTRQAVEALNRRCQMLNSLMTMDTLALGSDIQKAVIGIRKDQQEFHQSQIQLGLVIKGEVEGLSNRQAEQEAELEREKVLGWMTAVNYNLQQSDFIDRRQPGTGEWFLHSEEYRAWLAGCQKTLYCPGMPGAGKTILTAIIIDDITRRFRQDPDIGIAYIYCNYRQQEQQTASDLLMSLLKQLSQTRSPLPSHVKSFYNEFREKQPSLKDISSVLQSVISLYSRVYIIVDALDECKTSDYSRRSLLADISECQAQQHVSLIATSRPIPEVESEIADRFKEVTSLEIYATTEDVQKYLEGHASHLPKCAIRDPELQKEIKQAIMESVSGMFLLAQLLLDSLKGKKSPKAVRAALNQLPTGSEAYDEAYQDAMERIKRQAPEEEELARQVLTWIIFAKRPLKIPELEHAIATEPGERQLDKQNLCPVEDMLSVSAGLVTIDKESNIVRLVHYTTQQYFERRQKHWFPEAETFITTACMTYLSFDSFHSGYSISRLEYPLYDYASRYWGLHARETPTIREDCLDFLKCRRKAEAYARTLNVGIYRLSELTGRGYVLKPKRRRKATGLHVAAHFGINKLFDLIGASDINTRDSLKETPLSYAVMCGNTNFAQLLLSNGADVNLANSLGQTPLWIAVNEADEGLVRLLLRSRQLDVNTRDHKTNRTPLSIAASRKHLTIVKALVAHPNVDVNTTDSEGRAPLSWAVHNGVDVGPPPPTEILRDLACQSQSVMRVLLDHGAKLDSKDRSDRTALLWAAKNHNPIFFWLVEEGANPLSKDKSGLAAISMAVKAFARQYVDKFHNIMATAGIESVREVLVDLVFSDTGYSSPLSLHPDWYPEWPGKLYDGLRILVSSRHLEPENFEQLITTGRIDLNFQDHDGMTALSWAARTRDKVMVEFLLSKMADVNIRDTAGKTPLSRAYGGENVNREICQLLRQHGATI